MPMPKSPLGCPVDALFRLLAGPWTLYILLMLRQNGPTRFGALKRQVPGISAKMLTERLRMLEEAEVLYRHYAPTVPPQVTYGFTRRGEELMNELDRLSGVAVRWYGEDYPEEVGSGQQPLPAVQPA